MTSLPSSSNTPRSARRTPRLAAVLAGLAFFASFAQAEEAAAPLPDAAPVAAEAAVTPAVQAAVSAPKRADFSSESFSQAARKIANWVVDSADSKGAPFAIVDKVEARVFVFDADGRLRGAAAALLGIARGDHSAPGVGTMDLARIKLADRTTPAGRFEAVLGPNYSGKKILWVDYDSAISMHPVINTNLKERRPQRLATPTPLDNRISFGCINVPQIFFERVIATSFVNGGVVYVLPEVRGLQAVFDALR